MEDVIKSYLVALGFKVDSSSFGKMQETLRKLDHSVGRTTSGIALGFGKAGAAAASGIMSIGAATVDLMNKVAEADLNYQKFAMRMYMAKDAAQQFKIVTDSMGESINDIAWMPELNKRYQQLMKEAKGMSTPEDAGQQLEKIRDIRFEFTRMKVEATYGLQWVGYYLFKYFNVPIKEGKTWLQQLNDYIQTKIPEWSQKIAFGIAYVASVIRPTGRAVMDLKDNFGALFDLMPEGVQRTWKLGAGLGLLATGIALMIVGGPVAWAIAGFTSFLAVVQDFYRYVDGQQTAGVLDKWYERIFKMSTSIVAAIRYIEEEGALPGFGDDPGKYERMKNKMWTDFDRRRKAGNFREGGAPTGGDIGQRDLDTIASIESRGSGGYNAIGPWTTNAQGRRGRAMGRYGIMDYNWAEWAAEAGLPRNAPMTPENQDKVAKARLQKYLKMYKDRKLVYAAWHGGEGAANKLAKGDTSVLGRRDALGTSIGDYVNKATGSPFYPTGGASNYTGGSQQTNNVTLNLYGQTPEDQERRLKEIVKTLNGRSSMLETRMPAVAGIGQ